MNDDAPLAAAPSRFGFAWILGAALVAAAVALLIGDKSPKILLLTPLVFLGLAATIRYPLVALSGLIVMIVTNASQNLIVAFDLPSTAKLVAPGLFALLAARWMLYREVPHLGWMAAVCLAAFLALKLFSATYAAHWEASLKLSVDFAKDALVALLALAFMGHRRGIETITVTAVIAVAAICALGLYQLAFGPVMNGFHGFAQITANSGRFSGPLGDANFFACIIVFAVPLALFQLLDARRPLPGLGWAVIAGLLIAGLLATQSRGGLIGLVVAMAVLGTGLSLRQLLIFGLVGTVTVALAGALVSDEMLARFATIIGTLSSGEVQDASTEGRLASWRVAQELFERHPLLGVGAGNFNYYYQDMALDLGLIFRGEGRSTHSLYLEILTEQGLVGLMLMGAILGLAAVSLLRAVRLAQAAQERRLARHLVAFGAGLAGYLAAMTFLQDSFPRFLWLVIVLAVEAQPIIRRRLGDRGEPRLTPRSWGRRSRTAP